MKTINKSHIEKIQCPNCGLKQYAIVEHSANGERSYIHKCKTCKCKIGQFEWKKVK